MSKEKKNNSTNKKKQEKNAKAVNEKETKVTKNTKNKKKEEVIIEEETLKNEIIEEELEEREEEEILNEEKDSEEIVEDSDDENFIEEEEDFVIEEDDEDLIEDDDDFIDKEESIKEKDSKKEVKKEDKKPKKDKNSEEKIKKIEKIAKEKNKTSKHKNQSSNSNFLMYLDKNRFTIYGFIGGVLLTVLVVMIIWPDRIATLKDGTQNVATIKGENYTADELYESMKDHYSVSLLLDEIDNDILTKLYEEDDEMKKEVDSNAEYYLNMYEQYYGYTEEQFLSENGFANYDEFLDYLRLDYRRNKYLDEYIEKNIEDDEIDTFYKENVIGDINCQHILVEVSSSDDDGKLSDEDAKALAQEIIDKLNDGTSWEDVQKEYKDKITFEDLGYQAWDANLEDTFMEALKKLDDESYSDEPVKTSYGYHIIYRIDQKETPKLKEVKSDIIEQIVTNKKSEDSNLLYKALISLREENNLEFTDTILESKYQAYKNKYK